MRILQPLINRNPEPKEMEDIGQRCEYDLFVGCEHKRGGDLRAGSVTDSSRPGCKTGNVLANTRSRLSQRLSTAL
jgi:hypothetical protein